MEMLTENLVNLDFTTSLVEGFEPKGDDEKHYYIRGKFATIEAVNNNRRFYPRALWEREVAKYQDEIKNGTINTLMEWDHPKDRLEVDPSKAVAKINKLWIEGNYVMGEAVIFDVPLAEPLKAMIKYGVQLSVSSRARGRTDAAGVVQEFNLITFDLVAKPSDKSATMYGIFENFEGLDMQDDSILESLVNMVRTKDQVIEDLKEEMSILRTSPLKESEEDLKAEIESLKEQLAKHQAENAGMVEALEKREKSMTRRARRAGRRLNEGDIEQHDLDSKHDLYQEYDRHRREEDAEYNYRRIGEPYTQTHRHQDVTLLRDNDPASSHYSGEAEVLKIARLLQQTFGRDNVVGTVLGRDLDTGRGVRGVSADVEEPVRVAENGLDKVQLGLTESQAFLGPKTRNRSAR